MLTSPIILIKLIPYFVDYDRYLLKPIDQTRCLQSRFGSRRDGFYSILRLNAQDMNLFLYRPLPETVLTFIKARQKYKNRKSRKPQLPIIIEIKSHFK